MAWFTLEELLTRLDVDEYATDSLQQARDFATTVITAYLTGYTITDPPAAVIKFVALDVAKRYLAGRVVQETIGSETYRYENSAGQWLTMEEKTLLAPLRGTSRLWTQQTTRWADAVEVVYVDEDTPGADAIPMFQEPFV